MESSRIRAQNPHMNAINIQEFQNQCLIAHNKYRKKHDVPLLTLNTEISAYAQEWSVILAEEDTMRHRPKNKYGENIYWAMGLRVTGDMPVADWYDEIKYYDFTDGRFSSKTGHFTQVVWKKSMTFGVGVAYSQNGGVYVVANYDPPGNYVGQFPENVLPLSAVQMEPQALSRDIAITEAQQEQYNDNDSKELPEENTTSAINTNDIDSVNITNLTTIEPFPVIVWEKFKQFSFGIARVIWNKLRGQF